MFKIIHVIYNLYFQSEKKKREKKYLQLTATRKALTHIQSIIFLTTFCDLENGTQSPTPAWLYTCSKEFSKYSFK